MIDNLRVGKKNVANIFLYTVVWFKLEICVILIGNLLYFVANEYNLKILFHIKLSPIYMDAVYLHTECIFTYCVNSIWLQLVSTYLMSNRDNTELHIAASRLLLDVMPGLETTIVFQETVRCLYVTYWKSVCLAQEMCNKMLFVFD